MIRSKRHKRLLALALLTLFLFYWGGITLFSHAHVVNGSVVVHSHFYKGQHAHSVKTIHTIFYLSVIQSLGGSAQSQLPDACLSVIMVLSVPALCGTLPKRMRGTLSLRAPPVPSLL